MPIGVQQLPSSILPNLKSKSSIAKRAATALNENVRTKITHKANYKAKIDDGKTVGFHRGDSYSHNYFDYNAPSEKVPNKNIKQTFVKPGYYSDGEKKNNSYLTMTYYNYNDNNDISGLGTENVRMVSNEDNSVSVVSKVYSSLYDDYHMRIPVPALKTKNGETKTTFIPFELSRSYEETPLEYIDSPYDTDVSSNFDSFTTKLMYNFVNRINDKFPEKAKEFKKQFNMIDYFLDNKDEVFNKPVELVTKIYDELKDEPDTPIGTSEIVEFPETVDGERIEIAKQGNIFNITSYDKNNEKSMQGTFEILKDENGVPLKENEDGKILNQNDENYDDPQNKLCFNMEVLTYHEGIDQILSKFERNINLSDAKHRQNIKMSRYDRNGAVVREEEASTPLYSKKCLLKRMCKVYHNVYKSDLKEAKANFEHDMLNPDDLDPNLKSGD